MSVRVNSLAVVSTLSLSFYGLPRELDQLRRNFSPLNRDLVVVNDYVFVPLLWNYYNLKVFHSLRVFSEEIVFFIMPNNLTFVFPAFAESKLKENLAATCPIAKLRTETSQSLLTAATLRLLLKKDEINLPPLSVRQRLILIFYWITWLHGNSGLY